MRLILTARHYMEAAAYADPLNPKWANLAGYMNRMATGADNAERSGGWYQRGYALAVRLMGRGNDRVTRKRAKTEALMALTGIGALMKDLGRYDEALDYFTNAARRAVNTGRHRRAAVALHYAFALAVETEDYAAAVEYANGALKWYRLDDERLPALAHDFAYLLVRGSYFAAAFRILDGLPERLGGIWAMGMLQGLLVRAAAGADRPRKHREAERVALNLAKLHDKCAAPIFMNVAAAAHQLGDWERAAEHGARALELARAAEDRLVEGLALDLLEAVRRREPTPPPRVLPTYAPLAVLARRLAARMRRWNRKRGGGGR
ncbi:MAG TPA: tetratricopeptide repeat protein [Longimicrobium sp.]|nr:tetratricopeptide repeat protein [Longimicrobium sp.]